jgi:hypothetical protein
VPELAAREQRQEQQAADAEAQRRDVEGVERMGAQSELRDRGEGGPDQRRERTEDAAREGVLRGRGRTNS